MPALESSLAMLFMITAWVVAVVLCVVGAVVLVRWLSDRKLIGLALIASLAALVFIPLLRVAPEALSLTIFLAGFYPVMALIALAVVASAIRIIRTRRWQALPGLLLSGAAASLWYINWATTWIWPYAEY